jgi:hypothetical protein
MHKINHLLIIGAVWPEPGSSAGGSRTVQLAALFRSQGWRITLASAASESEFAADLSVMGIEKAKIALNDAAFDSFIAELNPDLVMFDRFMTEEQFGWRVAEHCPAALRMLDTIDLHCLRQARHTALKQNRAFAPADLFSDVAKREIASVLRCDLSLIISGPEMELLREHFKVDEELLHYLPFLLDPITGEGFKSFDERKGFVTIGNFLHEPNWDSVKYLKEAIWPLIRKRLPKAEMNVYGAYVSQKAEQLHKPSEGFFVQGRAVDAMEVISAAKVLLAPLRFGAGIKGKLVEAMQCGTPSVTTAVGAEGMSDGAWNGVVTDDPVAFADAAVKLYTDREEWLKAQETGKELVNHFYNKKRHGEKLLQRIAEVKDHLPEHRLKNFYGAMLMHHTLASTKYMSKWIEEKGRK